MLIVHEIALEMVGEIRPLLEQIARHDRSLVSQIRRSASSVPLNIGEGAYSQGGNARARYYNAAGSANMRSRIPLASSRSPRFVRAWARWYCDWASCGARLTARRKSSTALSRSPASARA